MEEGNPVKNNQSDFSSGLKPVLEKSVSKANDDFMIEISNGVKQTPQDIKEGYVRPSKEEYYLQIAKEIGIRSTCFRHHMGVIIVKDDQIIATGYIGAPRKTKDCLERGECLRDKLKIPHGTRYEICRSVHAEQNAIINAARAGVSLLGGDIYMHSTNPKTGNRNDALPCFFCKRMIINSGLRRVISAGKDGDTKIFLVDDWAKDWRENDIVDDKQQYGADQNLRDGLGGNPIGNNCNCG